MERTVADLVKLQIVQQNQILDMYAEILASKLLFSEAIAKVIRSKLEIADGDWDAHIDEILSIVDKASGGEFQNGDVSRRIKAIVDSYRSSAAVKRAFSVIPGGKGVEASNS
nr:hypothetical protein [uncultured Dongia sp.]